MKHVVLFDRGEYWDVIADYSGSPRHASMSPIEWENDFQSESFRSMRESQEGAFAAIAPKGCGKWTKDWAQAWDSEIAALIATSGGEIDFDGVRYVAADGAAVHTIRIESLDGEGQLLASRNDRLRAMLSAPVPMSDYDPVLLDGVSVITVGPCQHPCDLNVRVADPSRRLKDAKTQIRFR